MMLPLFAYGTLRDPQYRQLLFGRTFPMQPAEVTGFIVVSTGGGYLAATPSPGATIAGTLVGLDAAAYAIADAWEDLTVYERVASQATLADGSVQACFLYVRPDARGEPVRSERLSDRSRPEVLADITDFLTALDPKLRP